MADRICKIENCDNLSRPGKNGKQDAKCGPCYHGYTPDNRFPRLPRFEHFELDHLCATEGCLNKGEMDKKGLFRFEKCQSCRKVEFFMERQGNNRGVPEGTTSHRSSGYLRVKINGGWAYQHKIIMEEMLGRPLLPGENVHHKNGIRDDNNPSNLELWSTRQPSGQRVEDKVAWAREFLGIYGNEYEKKYYNNREEG